MRIRGTSNRRLMFVAVIVSAPRFLLQDNSSYFQDFTVMEWSPVNIDHSRSALLVILRQCQSKWLESIPADNRSPPRNKLKTHAHHLVTPASEDCFMFVWSCQRGHLKHIASPSDILCVWCDDETVLQHFIVTSISGQAINASNRSIRWPGHDPKQAFPRSSIPPFSRILLPLKVVWSFGNVIQPFGCCVN